MRRYLSPIAGTLILLAALSTLGCSRAAKKARLLDRAQQSFEAGQYDMAKIDYLTVLRSDAGNGTAIARLGQIWFDEGAPVRAVPFLLRTRDTAPQDGENRLRLVRAYLALGQTAEAKKEALAVLQGYPDCGEALILLTQAARSAGDVQTAERALRSFPKKETSDYCVAGANLALQGNDVAGARKALDQALVVEPKSVAAHMALAVLHVLEKELPLADEQFRIAADLSPARSPARIQYAEYLVDSGRLEAAGTFLVDMTKKAPDALPAWTLLARVSLLRKEYDKALALLENVFRRDGENLEGRLLQGETLLAKNETEKAIGTLEHLDKTYPGVIQIEYQLARAYTQSQDLSKAAAVLEPVVRANPAFADAVILWSRINLQRGHAAVAVSALEQLLQARPGFRPAQLVLADAYRAAGRLDDAAAVAREQIQLNPDNAQLYAFLGIVQQQQNKPDEARQSYEKAADLAPNDPGPINALLGLDLLQKHYDLASKRAQQLLEKNPNSAVAYYMKARVDVAEKDWEAAEVALNKAIKLDPSLTQACDLLVSVYLATGKLPAAITELEETLKKNPQNANALTLVGLAYEKIQNYAKAREAYDRLLVLQPDYVPALNNLAYLYSEHLNEPEKAFELAQKARTLQPADPSVADTLGWIIYKRGDYQQALDLFEEGAAKLAQSPELHFHLGMVYYMMGQVDAARTAFQQARGATSDFPGKAEVQRRLNLLGESAKEGKKRTLEELKRLEQEQPGDVVILTRLGEAYEQNGLPKEAAAAYEGALKVNPKLLAATFQLAKLYAGPLHASEKALALAKVARALAPNNIEATFLVAKLAYDAGNHTWAYDLLREIARQPTTDPEIFYSLGWAAYALGHVPEARAAMQKVLEAKVSSPQSEDAKTFLALTAPVETRGNTGLTEAERLKLLEERPDYVPVLMAEAAFETEHNQPVDAVRIYQKVLHLYPDFVPAKKLLAALYSEDSSQIEEAYALATSARKAFPNDPELARLLGKVNYQRKDYKSAIQLLEESDRGRSLDSKGLYYLGMAHVAAGHQAQGLEILQRALAAGLPDSISAEAKQAIGKLKRSQ